MKGRKTDASCNALTGDDDGRQERVACFVNEQCGESATGAQVQSSDAPSRPPLREVPQSTKLTKMKTGEDKVQVPKPVACPKTRGEAKTSNELPKTSRFVSRVRSPPVLYRARVSNAPLANPRKRPPPQDEAAGTPPIGCRRPNPVEAHFIFAPPEVYSMVDRAIPLLEPAARREAKRARDPSPARRASRARLVGVRL